MARVTYMRADQRRAAIIEALAPVLIESGGDLTALEMAAATGTSVGAIFRIFPDKESVIRACLIEIARTNRVEDQLAALREVPDLRTRLIQACEAMSVHIGRVAPIAEAVRRSSRNEPGHNASAFVETLRGCVAELLREVDARGELAMDIDTAAQILMGQIYADVVHRHFFDLPGLPMPTIVDAFLNGAVRSGTTPDAAKKPTPRRKPR